MTYREHYAETADERKLPAECVDQYGCPDAYIKGIPMLRCPVLSGECATCSDCWDREEIL